MSNLVEETFREGGLLSQRFEGYIPREQQITLARKIQESVREHKLLFGQAPTGVGKSLAALIPAVEYSDQNDAPVVIVTSSIVLQEQYFHKDIPTLEHVLGRKLSAALIKGRNNYLCALKAGEAKITGVTDSAQQEWVELLRWSEKTRTGDVSELDFVPKPRNWADFAALEDNECKGRQCPLYDSCHYYRERKKVLASKIIICNYHYFFHAMKNERMLPAGVGVVIMDEGHEISAIARDFQEQRYGPKSLERAFSAFLKVSKKLEQEHSPMTQELTAYVVDADLNLITGSIESMFSQLTHYFRVQKKAASESLTLTPNDRTKLQQMSEEHLTRLRHAVDRAKEYVDGVVLRPDLETGELVMRDDLQPDEELWISSLEDFAGVLRQRIRFLELYFRWPEPDLATQLFFGEEDEEREKTPEPPRVDETVIFWLQSYGEHSVSLHFKPSMSAPLMAPMLNTDIQEFTPIILSATLAVNARFDHLVRDLGVQQAHNQLVVSSPFDLENNLLWYLPQDTPAGNDKDNHFNFAVNEMVKVIQVLGGRSLCLFTSVKNMTDATNAFRKALPGSIEVIAQNEYPRRQLIEKMKKNPNVVLVGTKSFFTGIDIQGQNLSAVLIDKLPFPMIGDPVNDYLVSLPGGFWTFSIPELVVSLKQAIGRLNRTVYDKGVVAVYDGRLSTANYKLHIFNSFDFKVSATRDWERVETYLKDIGV